MNAMNLKRDNIQLIVCVLLNILAKSVEKQEYGPINLRITKVERCKGPKQIDCGSVTLKTWVEKDIILHTSMFLKNNLKNVKVKIIGKVKTTIMRKIEINNICDNVSVETLVKTLVQMTENCVMLKGSYNSSIDMLFFSEKFFGGSFMYGNYTFKNDFYTARCNYLCIKVSILFYPKVK